MLVDLDRIVLLFLERFDAMFRAGDVSGEEEEAAAGGEQAREAMADAKKSIAAIESMQAEKHDVALMVRAQRTFSRAVGKEVRWYTGCDCHDHIWRDTSLSDAEKDSVCGPRLAFRVVAGGGAMQAASHVVIQRQWCRM